MLDHIPEPSVRKVGNIYHHAQLVHSLHGFKAKGLEPLILEFRRTVGIGKAILVVPRQVHYPHALIVQHIQTLEVSLQYAALFQTQECRQLSLFLIFLVLCVVSRKTNFFLVCRYLLVKELDHAQNILVAAAQLRLFRQIEEAGKQLRRVSAGDFPLQIYMAVIFPQIADFSLCPVKQAVKGIHMKINKIHSALTSFFTVQTVPSPETGQKVHRYAGRERSRSSGSFPCPLRTQSHTCIFRYKPGREPALPFLQSLG